MNNDEVDFAGEVRRLLQAEGYAVQGDGPADEPQPAGRFWFNWRQPGMTDAEVGPNCKTESSAWTTALAHCLDISRIGLGLAHSSQARAAARLDRLNRRGWQFTCGEHESD